MIKYILLFLFFIKNVFALQINCEFEEVYQDGSVQNGIILISEKKLRYEYLDPSLYTIIKNATGLYIVANYQKKQSERIFDPLMNEIFMIYDDFPNINNIYSSKNFEAKVYFSKKHIFLSRISILSQRANLSIHFLNCENREISDLYFRVNPLHDYIY